MPRLAGPAGRSSGGLVCAGVVDVEVADELAVVEDGGEAPVEDDGDVAAGPSDADADFEFVDAHDAGGIDLDRVRGGTWRRVRQRLAGAGGRAGQPAAERGHPSDALVGSLLVVGATEHVDSRFLR